MSDFNEDDYFDGVDLDKEDQDMVDDLCAFEDIEGFEDEFEDIEDDSQDDEDFEDEKAEEDPESFDDEDDEDGELSIDEFQ